MDSKLIDSLLKGQINEEEIKQLERQLFEDYGIEINPPELVEMNKESLLFEFRKKMEHLREIKDSSTKHGRSAKQIRKDRKRKKNK